MNIENSTSYKLKMSNYNKNYQQGRKKRFLPHSHIQIPPQWHQKCRFTLDSITIIPRKSKDIVAIFLIKF